MILLRGGEAPSWRWTGQADQKASRRSRLRHLLRDPIRIWLRAGCSCWSRASCSPHVAQRRETSSTKSSLISSSMLGRLSDKLDGPAKWFEKKQWSGLRGGDLVQMSMFYDSGTPGLPFKGILQLLIKEGNQRAFLVVKRILDKSIMNRTIGNCTAIYWLCRVRVPIGWKPQKK